MDARDGSPSQLVGVLRPGEARGPGPTLGRMRRRTAIEGPVGRVARRCTEHDDARALRLALVDEIRSTVGFDAYAWILTDPVTEVGSSPLAEVPWLAELPRQIRLKYLTPLNRWTNLSHPPVACLHSATGGRPEQSLVWRELLVRYDVTDVASVVFRDRFGCWAFLELWRTGSTPPYDTADADVLAAITEPVTAALRRCQSRTFELDAPSPERSGPVVLMLTADLEVRAQTPDTEEYLRLLVPPEAGSRPVPAGAYNVAAQLLAVEAGVDHHSPSTRVHLADGLWLTLRAARLGRGVVADEIAVTIERPSPGERLDLFSRACGLTRREAELLGHLATGADTRRTAERMFVSEHTVQDHLKAIFTKTGAPSRRALLARATGR
jgi:DNA-binding CsgD family transcriptional regulator